MSDIPPAPSLVCWKCGASLADLSLPIQRLDECRRCGAALHVCRMCEFYDTSVARQCREPIAEDVKDKERANFCDYYRPRADACTDGGRTAAAGVKAKGELEALFGLPEPEDGRSAADRARAELESLFKKP